MKTGREKLCLNSDGRNLDIPEASWKEALKTAILDPVVQIRHAPIEGGSEEYRTHVASISKQVGCHFHEVEDEGYAVVAGYGRLHWGEAVKNSEGGWDVKWETPVDVSKGDSFVIPEGYAHQLQNIGDKDLIIVFGCPDTHIDDEQDRISLPDAPRPQPVKPSPPGMKIG